MKRELETTRSHTDVHDPAKPDRPYQTSVAEALNPQGEGETAPCTGEVLGGFPEEDGDAAAGDSCDATREHKEAAEGRAGRVDGIEDTEAEDEDEAGEGEGVETDKEDGRPAVFVPEECAGQAGQDEERT